jgi:hypothetical protein
MKDAMKTEISKLEDKIEMFVREMTIRIGGMLVAAVAVLVAIRYFG